jgi:tetratricopeptide (TPR) repeat protein
MGGFLGYWLSPGLRTFVDGRYPAAEILREYFRINRQREVRPGESSLEALDRRRVDFFFGVGFPVAGQRVYTTALLERARGWRLVHRTLDHAIYLRANARNRENLRRIAAYYQREGVPFDPESGLDPMAVIRSRPEWAAARRMLPRRYAESLAERENPDPDLRFRSLDYLAWVYAFLGSYADQIELDRQAVALRPEAKAAHRRLVHGLLRLGRSAEAVDAARELLRLDPRDPRSAVFERVALELAEGKAEREGRAGLPADAQINSLPLITAIELQQCCADFL